jgi:hypothetical protein
MVGISERPTRAIQQFKIADGSVCLKLGCVYITPDCASNSIRISGGLPAAYDEGDLVLTDAMPL